MIHVTYDKENKHWKVIDDQAQEDDQSLVVGRYPKKTLAISQGREAAKMRRTELCVHRKDNRITQKLSYGNDPRGTRG